VEYLLEGSFQKSGDNVRLIVQLIKADKDEHIWSSEYDRNWKDIFSVQSEVAQAIARELDAVITPEEKQIIERIPTKSLTAYDFYQRGEEELGKHDSIALIKAQELFKKALAYDSKFSLAYVGLAWVYFNKNFYKEYFSRNFLDSVRIFADIALSLDDQSAEAYFLKGQYYIQRGETDLAVKEWDKSIKYNPNFWQAYNALADQVYFYSSNNKDFVKGLEFMHKAVSLNHGKELPALLRMLGEGYGWIAGFHKEANHYNREAFILDGDSFNYYGSSAFVEFAFRNYDKSIEMLEKCYKSDSTNIWVLARLALGYSMLDQTSESMKYTIKIENRLEEQPWLYYSFMKFIGYVYWENSHK
jgi:tetratricopeptide (TPR) repeat protein